MPSERKSETTCFSSHHFTICDMCINFLPLVFIISLESLQLPLIDNERCGKNKKWSVINRCTDTQTSCSFNLWERHTRAICQQY